MEVSFVHGSYTVTEGDAVDVTVTLSKDPERSVTIPISTTNQDGASNGDYSGVPANLTFVPGDTEETISFTATDDDVHEDDESVKLTFGNTLPIGVTASGTTETTVFITDDDNVGVTISETSLNIEEGDSATYTVALASEPTGSVTVTVNAPANTNVTADPASLTFTDQNWNLPQTVTVTAKQDTTVGVDLKVTLTHTVSSLDDDEYDNVSAGNVPVTVKDDDVPSVTVSFEKGSYTVDEGEHRQRQGDP